MSSINPNPDHRKDLKHRSPNLGPYTTKGTLKELPSGIYFSDPSSGLGNNCPDPATVVKTLATGWPQQPPMLPQQPLFFNNRPKEFKPSTSKIDQAYVEKNVKNLPSKQPPMLLYPQPQLLPQQPPMLPQQPPMLP